MSHDDKTMLAHWIDALSSTSIDARQQAMKQLTETTEDIVPALLNALESSNSLQVKGAAYVLAKRADERAIAGLQHLLMGGDADLCRYAAYALARVGEAALEVLLTALQHDNTIIRRYAAAALVRLKSPDSLDALIVAMDDDSDMVRRYATHALLDLRDKRAQDAFITALMDVDDEVRRCAAEGLMYVGDQKSLRPLMFALRDMDAEVREAAAVTLGRIGTEEVVLPLIATLEDTSGSVCGAAIQGLGNIRDSRATDPLIDLLGDEEREMVWQPAVEALGKIGDSRAVPGLIRVFETEYNLIHNEVSNALVQIGDDAVPELIAALSHRDAIVRTNLILTLQYLGAIEAVPAIITLLADPDDAVQEAAVMALEDLGTDAAFDALDVWCQDAKNCFMPQCRFAGHRPDSEFVQEYISALDEPSLAVQRQAAQALVDLDDEAVDTLVLALQSDHTPFEVRMAVMRVLGDIKHEHVTNALFEMLYHNDPHISVMAVGALMSIGERGILLLHDCLRDDDMLFYVRRNIVRGLTVSGDDGAWRLLKVARESSDPFLRAIAVKTISKVSTTEMQAVTKNPVMADESHAAQA